MIKVSFIELDGHDSKTFLSFKDLSLWLADKFREADMFLIEVQKKTGIILLPSYLDVRIVPDDIEIKLDKTIKVPLDKNGNAVV